MQSWEGRASDKALAWLRKQETETEVSLLIRNKQRENSPWLNLKWEKQKLAVIWSGRQRIPQLLLWDRRDSARRGYVCLFLFVFATCRKGVRDTEANTIFLKRPWGVFKVLPTHAVWGLKALISKDQHRANSWSAINQTHQDGFDLNCGSRKLFKVQRPDCWFSSWMETMWPVMIPSKMGDGSWLLS